MTTMQINRKRTNVRDCRDINKANKVNTLLKEKKQVSIPLPFFRNISDDLAVVIMSEIWEKMLEDGNPVVFDIEEFRERHKCREIFREIKILQQKNLFTRRKKVTNKHIQKFWVNLRVVKRWFEEVTG
jgi:hypothetical protein